MRNKLLLFTLLLSQAPIQAESIIDRIIIGNENGEIEISRSRSQRGSQGLNACQDELYEAETYISQLERNHFKLQQSVENLKISNERLRKIIARLRGDDDRDEPTPQKIACANEDMTTQQNMIVKMKAFAYSSTGLDYTSTSSLSFAQDWIQKYSCDEADQYIKSFKRLKDFAYSSTGLDYTSTSSKSFALKNINSFCSDYSLETDFSKSYQFAYSSAGLNYTASSARSYALNIVKEKAFACQGTLGL